MKPIRLARTCLVAVLAAGPAAVAAMAAAAAPAGPDASVALTAVRVPQARVLNPGPPTGLTVP